MDILDKFKTVAAMLEKLAISQTRTDAQLAETDERLKEIAALQAKTDERLKEIAVFQAKTDVQLAETDDMLKEIAALQVKTDAQLAKTDAQLAKTDQKLKKMGILLGNMSNNQGDVAEEFFYNSIKAKPVLNQVSYDFIEKNVTRSKQGIEDEYDIVLVNGKDVAIIEVKYKAHQSDLEHLINKKYENFKKLYPEYRKFTHHLALASFNIPEEVKRQALKNGVMVLQRRGKLIEAMMPV